MIKTKKFIKYTLTLVVILTLLSITLLEIGVRDIKIGSNFCGVGSPKLTLKENKNKGYYDPTDCLWCLGKVIEVKKSNKASIYNCVGIKFEKDYE